MRYVVEQLSKLSMTPSYGETFRNQQGQIFDYCPIPECAVERRPLRVVDHQWFNPAVLQRCLRAHFRGERLLKRLVHCFVYASEDTCRGGHIVFAGVASHH
jgi:hypothetical protein